MAKPQTAEELLAALKKQRDSTSGPVKDLLSEQISKIEKQIEDASPGGKISRTEYNQQLADLDIGTGIDGRLDQVDAGLAAVRELEDLQKKVPETATLSGKLKGYEFLGGYDPALENFVDSEGAYDKLGPSAFEGLAQDATGRGALEQGIDYFSGLSRSGTDPIAEAQLARAKQEAQQTRKQNVDAALQELETRGQGGVGAQLLAESTGAQGAMDSDYLAGLDAAAMAAGRRDFGANRAAELGSTLSADALAANEARATGTDRYATDVASGRDDWANKRYADYYGISERNTDRINEGKQYETEGKQAVSNANTDLTNQATIHDTVDAPQTRFANEMDAAFASAGAKGGALSAGIAGRNARRDQNKAQQFQNGLGIVNAATGGISGLAQGSSFLFDDDDKKGG